MVLLKGATNEYAMTVPPAIPGTPAPYAVLNNPGKFVFQIEENERATKVRGEPKTAGGLDAHGSGGVTMTLVELAAEPFSATQLSVNVTVWGVLGINTLTEPEASDDGPLQPLTGKLLVRLQFKLPVKFDADQLTTADVLPGTVLVATSATDGRGPVTLMPAPALSGSTTTALSTTLVVSCVGCTEPLTLQTAPLGTTVGQLLLMVNCVLCV